MTTTMKMMKILLMMAIVFLSLELAPAHAMSPGPLPEPKISLEKALELAKAHAREQKMDLSHHYLDRIWITRPEGQEERCWIVSWSPKPEERKPGTGWIILTVKFDGTVAPNQGAVPWPDRKRDYGPPKK